MKPSMAQQTGMKTTSMFKVFLSSNQVTLKKELRLKLSMTTTGSLMKPSSASFSGNLKFKLVCTLFII